MDNLTLENVTLMSFYAPYNGDFDQSLFEKTIQSLVYSKSNINFKKNILITSLDLVKTFGTLYKEHDIEFLPYENTIENMNEYSKFMVFDLYKYFDTDFVLTTQHDGFVINADRWSENFLYYDYIGAPWPIKDDAFLSPFGEHIRVGNGGFSLRSKKLTEVPINFEVQWDCTSGDFYKHFNQNNFNEDGCISVHNRHVYENAGCKFAPLEVALLFSKETEIEENKFIKTFGFHKNYGWI